MGQSYLKRKVLAAILALVLMLTMVPTTQVMAAKSQAKDESNSKPKKTVLTEAKVDGKNVILTWKKNNAADGYQIYVSKAASGKFTELAKVNKSKTTYTITEVQDGTWYYKIRAYITVGKKNYYGTFSTIKSVTLKKVVTKGEIKIPKCTDPTLTAPTDVYLDEKEMELWEGSKLIKVNKSVPGLFWTISNEAADVCYIQYYDENDNLIDAGMNFPEKKDTLYSTSFFRELQKEDYTIKTIVITPVNSIDGSVNTNPASGQDKIGESTVFPCDIKVKVKDGKKVSFTAKEISDTKQVQITFSEKTIPYGSYFIGIDYVDEIGEKDHSGRGDTAESTGEMIHFENVKEYNTKYKKASKIVLDVFTDLEIKGADQATYTMTIHEAEIKK